MIFYLYFSGTRSDTLFFAQRYFTFLQLKVVSNKLPGFSFPSKYLQLHRNRLPLFFLLQQLFPANIWPSSLRSTISYPKNSIIYKMGLLLWQESREVCIFFSTDFDEAFSLPLTCTGLQGQAPIKCQPSGGQGLDNFYCDKDRHQGCVDPWSDYCICVEGALTPVVWKQVILLHRTFGCFAVQGPTSCIWSWSVSFSKQCSYGEILCLRGHFVWHFTTFTWANINYKIAV